MSVVDTPPPAKFLYFFRGGNLAVRSLPGLHPGAAHVSGWYVWGKTQVPIAEICASRAELPFVPADDAYVPTRTDATDPALHACVTELVTTAWVDAQGCPHYRAADRCHRAYDQRTALRAQQALHHDPAAEATERHLTGLISLGCEFTDLALTHAVALLDHGYDAEEATELTRATYPTRPDPPARARQRWAL